MSAERWRCTSKSHGLDVHMLCAHFHIYIEGPSIKCVMLEGEGVHEHVMSHFKKNFICMKPKIESDV